jgi:cytochrome P450
MGNVSSIQFPNSLLVPAGAGLAAHLLYNAREPKTIAEHLTYLLAAPIAIGSVWYNEQFFTSPIVSVLASLGIYLATLSTSVVAYRLSPFHPLARYPGPLLAKISRLHALRITAGDHQYQYYHALHEKYGNVVRTGPDHLHIREVDAVKEILGHKNPWVKGPRYKVTKPPGTAGGLLFMTDQAEHAQRRKVWDRAFNPSSLKGYEPMLANRTRQLSDNIRDRTADGSTLDLAEWFAFFSFDFMGDFALGGAFDMMAKGEDPNGNIEATVLAIRGTEIAGTMPWLSPFLLALPRPEGAKRQLGLAKAQMIKRREGGSLNKDLFYHILGEDDGSKGPKLDLDLITLILEASLAITAGSDTTAMSLTNTFFYLMTNPEVYARLKEEIDENVPADIDVADPAQVTKLPYLQAVLNESMRLLPAVPNGVQRRPPPGAGTVLVAGNPVPQGTTVQIGTFSLHRDPRYFYPKTNEFWPERWLLSPQEAAAKGLKHDTNAFMPFSVGPTNCVGRRLAEIETRVVVATLVRKFDFKLKEGFPAHKWESEMKDHFVMARGMGLPVTCTPRTN